MFTGIIEGQAQIESIQMEGTNLVFELTVPFGNELKVDQSLAHNGVCLTVIAQVGNRYQVVAIAETIKRTSISTWKKGDMINVERCMAADGRFDGHIVQGHVDTTATCTSVENKEGSWLLHFIYNDKEHITVEKGSVCIDGISLTVVESIEGAFSVAIISYTYDHTNLKNIQPGDSVNLEFDIIGKYLAKFMKR